MKINIIANKRILPLKTCLFIILTIVMANAKAEYYLVYPCRTDWKIEAYHPRTGVVFSTQPYPQGRLHIKRERETMYNPDLTTGDDDPTVNPDMQIND